jgi:CheY-like chemotaxis protein
MDRPRVLLAEDHASIAQQLRTLLEAEFDVVAVVDDGPWLIRAAEELRPDVIVTDIVMPGLHGRVQPVQPRVGPPFLPGPPLEISRGSRSPRRKV